MRGIWDARPERTRSALDPLDTYAGYEPDHRPERRVMLSFLEEPR